MDLHMELNKILFEKTNMKTFSVMYKTLGMTLCAGQYTATTVDGGKCNAANLLQLRHVKKLEGAEIRDSSGKPVALLRMQTYPRTIEWITIRN